MRRYLLPFAFLLLIAAAPVEDPRLDAIQAALDAKDVDRARALGAELESELVASDLESARLLAELGKLASTGFSDEPATIRILERAVALLSEELGPGHEETLDAVQRLADSLIWESRLDEAAALLEEAYAAGVELYGEDGAPIAALLERMGELADTRSDYATARRQYERSLQIHLQHEGENAPDAAALHYRLGRLDYIQGNNPGALESYGRAYEGFLSNFGEEDRRVAVILEQRAAVFSDMGEFDRAIEDLDRARVLMEKSLPPNHPSLGALYHRYGETEMRRGNLDAAREPLERALAIREETYGPDHTVTDATLMKLAQLERRQGRPAEAIAILERVRKIRLEAFGADHPWYASTLYSLALNHTDLEHYDEALDYALEAERIQRNQLREDIRAMPERTGLMYAADRSEGAGLKLALTLSTRELSQEDLQRVWDAQVDARSFVLDELAYRRQALGNVDDQALAALNEELAAASSELTRVRTEVQDANDPQLLEARARREAVERRLGEIDDLVANPPRADRVDLATVSKTLPSSSALVSYARYQSYFSREFEYLALVRTADGQMRSVDLGMAESIDGLVQAWRGESGRGAQGDEAQYRQVAGELREKIWDPIAMLIEDSELALIVPDGQLSLVNFASLPREGGGYLVESPLALHVLGTERDAVDYSEPGGRGVGLLAVGAPNFDRHSEEIQIADASSLFRGAQSGCQEFRSTIFGPLPGTAEEIESIVALWPDDNVTVLRAEQADEASVKALASRPRVLHLATHGFFLRSDCSVEDAGENRGVGSMAPTSEAPRSASPDENLLTLSGLALAGANGRDQVAPGEEDGVLTAEEVAALDLSSVEWAVLSACDSGVGDIHVGEGVLGLRRAFRAAGARTLILSLWSVDDLATRDWMTELYRARFVSNQSTAHAARSAALSQLENRRANGESTHPFYWAGFVAIGDWR